MTDPDVVGKAGKAWKVVRGTEDYPANIGTWLVEGVKPDQFHPFWNQWMVSCVHLRPIEGQPEPFLQYPEAQYEFLIFSLDPERGPYSVDPWKPAFLEPPDAIVQFDGVNDEQAHGVAEAAVRSICNGFMSPDSDYREEWGSAILATVVHYKQGVH